MYRSMRAIGASVWILALSVGCGGDDTPDLGTNVGNAMEFTPPPVIDDEPGANDAAPTTPRNRWGSCSSSDHCLANEQCIRGITESYNVCLSTCVSVDDCEDPSTPARSNFTAFMTCSEFQGAKRCILGCQSNAQCIAGMQCVTGACVWK